ncbi:choice-of-anchor D domain-containing protein [Granulicella tundricola]|uniref:choice-of-anchor D domain-containing protein n=1 Tax=Granulicella tundricola TaxID=940615 RepID=UPI0002D6F3D8|nr:choice-of-anchor D domain-containing protein [Granulicella tundricola]
MLFGLSVPAAFGQTTSISGIVYAPNGKQPLPNVLVYVPTTAVDAFTPGVSCPVPGTPPSGTPLVGTTTATDGSFSLGGVPIDPAVPLVIQSGRWRRQVTIATAAGVNTVVDPNLSRFPRNQTEGDIPKFAVATGSQDQVECVLRKVGVDDAEFTNMGGTGRINLFSGSGSPGARIDSATPSQVNLMTDSTVLNQYDVLMLPCQGNQYIQPAGSLANFVSFANAGGRVYSSHYSYVWMYNNAPFNSVVNWKVTQPDPGTTGTATVDTSFSQGQILSNWLQLVGATTTLGQIQLSVLKHDLNGVVAPTQSWLTLNNTALNNPVMQFVFNTPVTTTTNQCGRVLFNEYHVEQPTTSPINVAFPSECPSATTDLTPQEKLLEFSLFELTSDGSAATLTPTSQDFGSEPVGFTTAAKPFVWTNNSTFPAAVTIQAASGDFSVVSPACGTVASGASCTINVVFTPTALGARTGTLSVGSGTTTLTASLTGTGVPALALSPTPTPSSSTTSTSLDFGSVDVGATGARTLFLTNSASGGLPFPQLTLTGPYSVSSNCTSIVPANGSCTLTVTFHPTTTGASPGSITISSAAAVGPTATAALTGNGVDFTFVVTPASGNIIAGYPVTLSSLTSPIAGFANPVTLSCVTNAPATTCTPKSATILPSAPITTEIDLATTSQYTVIGYSGLGGNWLLGALAIGTGSLLWFRRRSASTLARATLVALLLAVASLSVTGCSGKLPAENSSYTKPGSYSFTITATDGFLVHTATYNLTVTSK